MLVKKSNVNALHQFPTVPNHLRPLGSPVFRFDDAATTEKPTSTTPAIAPETQARLDKLAQYEALNLGPEDIDQLARDYITLTNDKTRLTTERDTLKSQRQDKDVDPTEKKKQQLRKEVREEVLVAIPELAQLNDLAEVSKTLKEVMSANQQAGIASVQEALIQDAASFVKHLQIDTSTNDGIELALAIGDEMERIVMGSPKLLERFTKGDRTVAKEARDMLAKSPMMKHMNIPRKALPRRPFTTFSEMEGEPGVESLSQIRKDLPKRGQFRAIAERTHGLIFHD